VGSQVQFPERNTVRGSKSGNVSLFTPSLSSFLLVVEQREETNCVAHSGI
jgi:hypothetical protein